MSIVKFMYTPVAVSRQNLACGVKTDQQRCYEGCSFRKSSTSVNNDSEKYTSLPPLQMSAPSPRAYYKHTLLYRHVLFSPANQLLPTAAAVTAAATRPVGRVLIYGSWSPWRLWPGPDDHPGYLLMSKYALRFHSNRCLKRFLLKECSPITYTRLSVSNWYFIYVRNNICTRAPRSADVTCFHRGMKHIHSGNCNQIYSEARISAEVFQTIRCPLILC